jgi:negative regulator of flagellin synthesis FlgM
MRIGLFNATPNELASELNAQQLAAKNAAKTGDAAGEDRATLTSDSTSVGSLVSSALASPEVRQDKVDSLREAVNNGQYNLDPSKIAASIVDDYA